MALTVLKFCRENEALAKHAYYKTGGRAAFFYEPTTVEELSEARRDIAKRKLSCFLLGGGSNSLVSDEPWQGAVISFAGLRKLEVKKHTITAGAGIENSELATAAVGAGLDGASWMYRLPGQLGGTVRMNARCYGGEISGIATSVTTVASDGSIKTYTGKSMFRGYKDTIFMQNDEAIAEVQVELFPGDTAEIREKMDFCEKDRTQKGQFVHPTCGCVFKNDYSVGVPSGKLLDAAGAKNLSTPKVAINPHHANFVYNVSAGSKDILEMTLNMRNLVYQKFGVWMAYEMELLGSFPNDFLKKLNEARPQQPITEQLEPLRLKFQSSTKT